MRKSHNLFRFALVTLGCIYLNAMVSFTNQESAFLIDDFSRKDQISALNTEWRSFSDRVMGGNSQGQHRFVVIDDKRCIRLTGDVSLENNGGFIQVALSLDDQGQLFDASRYQGIRINVRGNNARYYIHLRSRQTQQPWQYYAVDFQATEEWRTLEIPFSSFKPENLRENLNTAELRRIAIVGAWQEFKADVAVSRLEFYR